MTQATDVEIADRLSRRRARLTPFLAILFLSGQVIYAVGPKVPTPATDQVKVGIWVMWAVTLLTLLATGGGLFHGKKIRALMEDEATIANRYRAYAVGFWLALSTAISIYVMTAFDKIAPREAIHIIITASIAGALITFGVLERRAHRSG